MSGPWMAEVADLVDAANGAAVQTAQTGDQAPPVSKPARLTMAVPSPVDDTPTEPATSLRSTDPQVQEWPVELQLPTREIGPRPEPEVYPCRFLMNDGQWTAEEHVAHLHKAAQAGNFYAWNREAREEAERQNREYVRSMSGKQKSNVQASRSIHSSLTVHLPRVLHPCEFFQMSMMLFVRMILLRLQCRSRSFQRKPLQ